MLDRDLAALYQVMTGRLNEAVKRNIDRFPVEFRFQLTKAEVEELIANCDNLSSVKYAPVRPYVFTEQGVAMLSAVLKSDVAVRESIRFPERFMFRLTDPEMNELVTNCDRFERVRFS